MIPTTGSTAPRNLALLRSRWTIPRPSAQCSRMPTIMSGSPREPKTAQKVAGQSRNSYRSGGDCARIGCNGLLNKRGARVLGVMRPRMQLSFLFDCDDVALPALKLDPDTELACVVPADIDRIMNAPRDSTLRRSNSSVFRVEMRD